MNYIWKQYLSMILTLPILSASSFHKYTHIYQITFSMNILF